MMFVRPIKHTFFFYSRFHYYGNTVSITIVYFTNKLYNLQQLINYTITIISEFLISTSVKAQKGTLQIK